MFLSNVSLARASIYKRYGTCQLIYRDQAQFLFPTVAHASDNSDTFWRASWASEYAWHRPRSPGHGSSGPRREKSNTRRVTLSVYMAGEGSQCDRVARRLGVAPPRVRTIRRRARDPLGGRMRGAVDFQGIPFMSTGSLRSSRMTENGRVRPQLDPAPTCRAL
jgi:hypothetical protein